MKKVKAKKTAKKITTRRVKPEQYFYACNGCVIKNIKELAKEIRNMDENVFRHHVNQEKNDFANWVKEVIGNKKIAEEIGKITDKEKTELILLRNIHY